MYIKFLDAITPTECAGKQIAPNIVELKFADEIIVDTSGFNAYLDKECEYDIGGNSYVGFTTMYRNDETTVARNGYQLSNDGSVYTPPIPVVTFNTNGGGTLDGITEQQLTKYEQLKVVEQELEKQKVSKDNCILVYNKCDLLNKMELSVLEDFGYTVCKIQAKHNQGITELKALIREKLNK